MLSVCLVFLYIMLSAYITGFLVLTVIGRVFGQEGCRKRKIKPDAYVMAGLAAVTVYAQIFSLFYTIIYLFLFSMGIYSCSNERNVFILSR